MLGDFEFACDAPEVLALRLRGKTRFDRPLVFRNDFVSVEVLERLTFSNQLRLAVLD